MEHMPVTLPGTFWKPSASGTIALRVLGEGKVYEGQGGAPTVELIRSETGNSQLNISEMSLKIMPIRTASGQTLSTRNKTRQVKRLVQSVPFHALSHTNKAFLLI